MRSAILVADGKVIAGPSPANEIEAVFKAAVKSGGNGVSVLDIWTEDGGRERRQKFSVSAEPKPEKSKAKKA